MEQEPVYGPRNIREVLDVFQSKFGTDESKLSPGQAKLLQEICELGNRLAHGLLQDFAIPDPYRCADLSQEDYDAFVADMEKL